MFNTVNNTQFNTPYRVNPYSKGFADYELTTDKGEVDGSSPLRTTICYLVDLGTSLKSILKNNIIPVTELTKAKIENIFKRMLSILSLSFQSII